MRRRPNAAELIASLLLEVDRLRALLFHHDRVIPYESAKRMTAAEIRSHYEIDHYPVRVADAAALDGIGIPYINHPCNLQHLPKAEHLRKTSTIDAPQIAKSKRIRKKQPHAGYMFVCKIDERPRSKRKIPSRPFPKRVEPRSAR